MSFIKTLKSSSLTVPWPVRLVVNSIDPTVCLRLNMTRFVRLVVTEVGKPNAWTSDTILVSSAVARESV